MDLSTMRAEIEAAVKHEAEHGTLAGIVDRTIAHEKPQMPAGERKAQVERVVGIVRSYVEAMAPVIEVTLAAAEREGVADQVKPIFETAMSYVTEGVDFIPDELGLAGLVDDAYLVHGLMQELSQRQRSLTGASLLPDDYFAESQRVRRMIGEPTATRLDVAVVAFARRQNVRETVEQITERIGGRGMSMDLPSAIAFPGAASDDDLPELNLGSLGDH